MSAWRIIDRCDDRRKSHARARAALRVRQAAVHAAVALTIVWMIPASGEQPQHATDVDTARTPDSRPATNRLATSGSPYLLLHADNPVDWYPWGPEALEKAKREDKPIFLSVGYSTCFWCHVAERTIYSNPAIARLMNQWFVNVKVDREQRPDIDQIYMLATRMMTGHGGWPNNVFLTPDLRPFFAGSYFPPQDDSVRGPGFPTILRALHDAWTNERSKELEIASNVAEAMRGIQHQMDEPTAAPIEPDTWMRAARESLLAQFDSTHGGIGSVGPKFPRSPDLALLLGDLRIHGDDAVRIAVTKTLDAMVFGGIHDHLAGGFHRYSTDRMWSVPHFEKMLSDNVQLLQLYAESFELTGNALHRLAAYDIAQYLIAEMTAPAAEGFFTAQDAQIDGIEGQSYVWTHGEIAAVLGEDSAKRFFTVYELTPLPEQTAPGVVEVPSRAGEQAGALRIRVPIDRTLKEAGSGNVVEMLASLAPQRRKLLAARNQRRQPARDEKILTDLNGLSITAFVAAGRALNERKFTTRAQTVADRIWTAAFDPKTRSLQHEIFRGRAQTNGFLQDYAHLAGAFMSLHSATGNRMWRDRAAVLAGIILERFVREDGSFAMTAGQQELLIPVIDEGDGDVPSGTSAAIDLLLQVAAATPDEPRFAAAATRAVSRLSGTLQQYPALWATAVTAVNVRTLPGGSQTAVAAGDPPAKAQSEFHIPVTSDHVNVGAVVEATAGTDRVLITVTVDDGYHINANPASFDFLVPTSVRFPDLGASQVAYPQPTRFRTAFASEALDVYEGTVRLIVTFPGDALPETGTVRGIVKAQACDERVCLPPSDMPFTITRVDR